MELKSRILADADRCVLCGMCLPHCPTYTLSHNEAESPRGRITLMAALAKGQLEPTAELLGHLDRCLTCRACEAMCPSQVPYARLLHHSREYLRKNTPPAQRLLPALLASPRQRALLRTLLRIYQVSGFSVAMLKVKRFTRSRLGRALQSLPELPAAAALPAFSPAHGPERGQVMLFTGCTGDLFERALLHDAIHLLNHLGYSVLRPEGQGCCGALHLQRGDGEAARRLARQNLVAFTASTPTPIVTVASGCGALLHDYAALLPETEAEGLAARVQDIHTFLAQNEWPATARFTPLPRTVAVHDPCSLRNGLRAQQAVYTLLRRIPQLNVVPLPGNERCCGAAGSYYLDQPAIADALRADKLAAVDKTAPDILVSANIGCAMHIAAGLREGGHTLDVLHPLTLLARQLATPGPAG